MSFAWHEIRDYLMHSSTTLSFQRAFDVMRRTQHPLVAFRDPAAVLDALHRGSGDPDQKNRILTALIKAAQAEDRSSDCALAIILLALWPGLDAVRRRLTWRRVGTAEDITADILARATETICRLDLARVTWIAATVLRNTERDMIRARQQEQAREYAASDVDPDDVRADETGRQVAPEHMRLKTDIEKLIGADFFLIVRVAVQGFTQAEVAAELGISEEAARKRYQRAMRKLRDALLEFL